MAILIEAYEATGAIALADRYHLQFLSSLIDQTAKMRRTPEEQQTDEQEEKLQKWLEDNKQKSVQVRDADGKSKKIDLSSFAVKL